MANLTVPVNQFTKYDSSITVSKVALTSDSSLTLSVDGNSDERVALHLEVTGSAIDFTVNSGAYEDSVYGDLVISSAVSGDYVLALSSSRFKDADGNIIIDVNQLGTDGGNAYAVAQAQDKS